nr:endo-1,4-beta-xylanase [uncultured bacterium]
MKHYRILFLAAALTGLASCAVDPVKEFPVEKPQDIAQYEYLNDYDVLKNYVDRTASPDFKLGAALAASDFNSKSQVYALAVSNFDEMTAGNAMKYASVVDSKGNMNFDTVKEFVNNAEAVGMTVYGHTLAWHSQQNNKYLNTLIADKELDLDPDATRLVEDASIYFKDYSKFPFYVMGYEPTIENGILKSSYPGSWYQYFVMEGVPTNPKNTYTVTAKIKGSTEGQLTVQMGNWDPDARPTANMTFTTEWAEQSVKITGLTSTTSFIVFQPGTYEGDIEIEWIKVSHEEALAVTIPVYILQTDFNDGTSPFGGWGLQSSRTVEDGALKISNPTAGSGYWEAQMAYDVTTAFEPEQKYFLKFKIKATGEGTFRSGFQVTSDYSSAGDFANVALTTDWKEVTLSTLCTKEGATRLIFSFGDFAGDIFIDDFQFYYEISGTAEPQTPEEKKDTLTWAMNNWIKGMMEATEGKVVAWDAVNEAISGADYDGDGKYDLQHAETGDPANNFYWQDYLGDEDYVRIVVAQAREHFQGDAADLKLFINDYNLESDWDDNKKLKSLIEWIKVWESDGVTKIDGIGTQMHVSCYENPDTQASKEEHVVKMLELMAASGKLVKISELDMGYVDANGNTVPTTSMTEEQHQAMARYYRFIISKYFEIIPAAQQYGITQWCITDAPGELGTGWRGGEPVGLWDQNYRRKHTYAGFVAGLQGE